MGLNSDSTPCSEHGNPPQHPFVEVAFTEVWEVFDLRNNSITPMTSDTPPISPEMQAQPTTTTAPGGTGPGRRPWLEPVLVVTAIGLAVTILGLLLSIAFGIYSMNARIDTLDARIDTLGASLNARIDALGADFRTRIDALGTRIDALDARVDALGADFNIRIEQVYQLLLPEKLTSSPS